MKPPTSEDITRQLQQAHFPQKHDRDLAMAPVGDTPMVVTIEQLRPYELNPRVVRNPLYHDIKASIRERGLDQPPAITRRPDEPHFIIRNGGNTRLSILGELWQETREERFFRIHCLFRPWQSESHALLGHLAESDLHGQLTFIERALAVAKLQDMFQYADTHLTQRELAARLSEDGYPISQSHISRMFDALEHLLPAIPQMLYAGLGKSAIVRLISLRRRAESIWNRYFGAPEQFPLLWFEILSTFDGENRNWIRVSCRMNSLPGCPFPWSRHLVCWLWSCTRSNALRYTLPTALLPLSPAHRLSLQSLRLHRYIRQKHRLRYRITSRQKLQKLMRTSRRRKHHACPIFPMRWGTSHYRRSFWKRSRKFRRRS